MTAGQYVKDIFDGRNISLTDITEKLELKSRNILYRLFNDKLSYRKAKDLIHQIDECINFSEFEKAEIAKLLEYNKNGTFLVETRKILSHMYDERLGNNFFVTSNGDTKPLSEAIGDREYDSVTIYMSNIHDLGIISEIKRYLQANQNAILYNYLEFRFHKLMTAYELLSLIELSNYSNYNPMQTENVAYNGLKIIKRIKNMYYLQEIELVEDKYMFIETEISENYYNYIKQKHSIINARAKPLKKPVNMVKNYIEIMEDTLLLDKGDSFYCEGAPCFGYLTADILIEMFKNINYFGYPADFPYVQKLLEIVRERHDLFYNTSYSKQFLFDEKHLKNMILTGISIDHPEEFKPMSIEQRSRFFNWLIEYSQKNPRKLSFRILKNKQVECSFVYEAGKMLYKYCAETGYTNGAVIMINNAGVNEIMHDFSVYLWNEFTYSEEESIDIIKKLLCSNEECIIQTNRA